MKEQLIELYSHSLKIPRDRLERDDDIYSCGADSLELLSLLAKLEKQFSVKIDAAEIASFTRISTAQGVLARKRPAG